MEFLKIGESKLKIVMNTEELRNHGIEALVKGEHARGARRKFWSVLAEATAEVGFDPAHDKVLVQFYPNGTVCEIFVTKLGLLPPASAKLVSVSDRVTLISRSECAFSFDSDELLFRAVRAVLSLGSTDELWAEILRLGDRHYLVTEEYGKGDESSDLLLLSEFGTRLTADSVIYLREHAQTVSVGNIGRLLRTD